MSAKTYTFFFISPPNNQNPKEWASLNCDAYGFEYDPERCGNVVVAWSTINENDAEKVLGDKLSKNGVSYSTHQINDLELFFGL